MITFFVAFIVGGANFAFFAGPWFPQYVTYWGFMLQVLVLVVAAAVLFGMAHLVACGVAWSVERL